MPIEPNNLRTAQVAELLHVSPKTVSRWAQEGRLPCLRTLGGHRRYPDAEIRALLETCPSYPRPASHASRLTVPASLLSVARWPFGIVLGSIGAGPDPGTADFLRADLYWAVSKETA
jgi:excisionase family DNA binding protein